MQDNSSHAMLDWAGTLKVLADETRLHIIYELLKHELSVNEISEILNLKVYNISRHLKILESSGLVDKRRKGTRRIYNIVSDLRSRYSDKDQVLDLGCCKFEFSMFNKKTC